MISLSRRRFMMLSALSFADPFRMLSASALAVKDTLTIAYPTDIVSWEPNQTNPLQSAILKCVYDQPLNISSKLTLSPGIVKSYAWLDDNNQILQLEFQEGVVFHNGQPLTSEDFYFSFFERVKKFPDSLLAGIWGGIMRIETPTPYSAIVYFSWPMATAPAMMADIPAYLLPKRYYQAVGENGFRAHPVGSGPYKVTARQSGMHIILDAYENYWQSPPAFKRVIFLIAPDKMTRLAMLETGEADLSLNFSTWEADKIAKLNNLKENYQPTSGIILLQMVNQGVMQDKRVRLALHHAIDKSLISKALFQGKALPIATPAGKGMAGYDPEFNFPYDPELAIKLLAEAGYHSKRPLLLNFYTTKGAIANDLEIAKAISQQWEHIGIRTQLIILTPAMIADYQNQKKFDGALLQGWNPVAGDPATYSGLLLNQNVSMGLWKSDDLIQPLAALDKMTNYAQRINAYKKFDRWQVEQGYSIPLLQNISVQVAKNDLFIPPNPGGILAPYHIRKAEI
ncbi:ABC transporter substrate-binding protein [Citrobacter freundii]